MVCYNKCVYNRFNSNSLLYLFKTWVKSKINHKIDYWIFTGGGVKNYTLMKDIRDILHDESLFISDELGFDSSFIESVAFAYISIRTVKGLPSAFPETTGCCRKNICGKIYLP